MQRTLKIIIISLTGILCLRFFFVPLNLHIARRTPFNIRIRLAHNAGKVELSSDAACTVKEYGTGRVLSKNFIINDKNQIVSGKEGIRIDEKEFKGKGINISPHKKDSLSFHGKRYRGQIDILNTAEGLDVINVVELEDYLKGVIPREMNRFWPFAAMKAQTIASRSFAVNKALKRKEKEYDLRADTFAQVYGGISSERWRTTKAVIATKDKVLIYDDKIIPAYFHSCCGGYTRNISDAWGGQHKALKKVKCLWCRWSPHFRWRIKIPAKDIIDKFARKGYSIKRIDNIVEGDRDSSKRLKYLRIKSGDRWFEINVNEFRSAIGNRIIKSSNFYVKKYPRFYMFSGYGWGHGVGMCQWGALGLAVRRSNEEKILGIYYPGAKIVDLRQIIK